MSKRTIFIILLLIAVLGGLGYHFVNWATGDKHAEASSVDGSKAKTEASPGEGDAVLEQALTEEKPAAGVMEGASAVAHENEAAGKLAAPAQSGQSRIMKLIEGAKLLDEATVAGVKGEKTIRVYDVGDNFKYPMVRVETLETEEGASPMTAMVADHLMVRVKDPKASSGEVREWMRGMGVEVRKAMHTAGHFLVSPGPASTARPSFLLESLQKRLGDAVEVAEPDFIVFTTEVIPNDPRFDQLWGLHNTGAGSAVEDADIDAPEAWEITQGSRSVKVGVIDTGVDYEHPDLVANMWTNPGEIAGDGIDNDNNGFVDDMHGWDFAYDDSDPMDENGHGTHCSGTIGGLGNNGVGVAGVNWEVSIVALKFLNDYGRGSISDAIDAVNYAVLMDLNLTSNSWGGGGYSQLMKDTIERAGAANQLFVAAAGNDSTNMENRSFYPACYSFDADVDPIISVASIDSGDRLSGFSNYGATTADLGAPGSSIYSTTPDNGYSTYSGTSMATPHVSGALALYFSMCDADFKKAKEDLLASVVEIPALEGRCVSNGRLNVFELLMRCKIPFIKMISEAITSDAGEPQIYSPGETVSIKVDFENIGLETAHGLVAKMSTTDEEVELLVDQIDIGALAGRSVYEPEGAFRFFVPESYEAPKEVPITIDVTDSSGTLWSYETAVKLNREVTFTRQVVALVGNVPLEGVEVEYTTFGKTPITGVAVTNADGVFSFQGIDSNFVVTLKKAGFLALTADLNYGVDEAIPYVMRSPRIEYDSDHLVIEVLEGETRDAVFSFSNVGDSYMTYQVGSRGYGRIGLRAPVPVVIEHTIEDTFLWTDISESGEAISLGDDTVSAGIDLGFNFNLYGSEYNNLKVGSNGLLLFGGEENPYDNSPLDNASAPNKIFAYFWSDLDFRYGNASAYFKRERGKIIFQFNEVPFYFANADKVSAQVILSEDNQIKVYYKELGLPRVGTVGIRGNGVEEVHQVSFDETVLGSGTTLLIKQNDGSFGYVAESGNGVLQAGERKRVPIKINAGSLAPGVYRDSFKLSGEWADYDGDKDITVEIRVLPAPNLQVAELILSETERELEGAIQNDGDGFVEAGETAELKLSLKNIGSLDTSLLLAEIVSDSPKCTVLQLDSSFDPIVSGETIACELPFVLQFAESVPLDGEIQMYLKLLDSDFRSRSIPFVLRIGFNYELVGQVTEFETGIPLSDAVITCDKESISTDSEGNYQFTFSRPGSYQFVVSKQGYQTYEQTIEIPVLEVLNIELFNPQIQASVEALEYILYKGEVLDSEIELFNLGNGPLEWEIVSNANWQDFRGYELEADTPFVWDDIASRGRNVPMEDDVVKGPLALDKGFEFYGQIFENIYVSSNGFISFEPDLRPRYRNADLESDASIMNKLAFFWKDLVVDDGTSGRCYTHTEADGTFVLQFSDVPAYTTSNLVSVQTRLKPDGSIVLVYDRVDDASRIVVGLKGKDRSEVFDLEPHKSKIHSGNSLTIKPNGFEIGSWADAMSGTINKDSAKLRYIIDTTDISSGSYQHFIIIKSNDTHGRETLSIPVRLAVYENDNYERFIQSHNMPNQGHGILDDPDQDGFNNLEEFAFGFNPREQENYLALSIVEPVIDDPVITSMQSSDGIELKYRRRTDDCGLSYVLECSSDLKVWSPATITSEAVTVTALEAIETVSVTVQKTQDSSNCFYRVKVSPESP